MTRKTEIPCCPLPEAFRIQFEATCANIRREKGAYVAMPNESGFYRFFQNKADRFIFIGVAIVILLVFVSGYIW
jgi:hypothetical protein